MRLNRITPSSKWEGPVPSKNSDDYKTAQSSSTDGTGVWFVVVHFPRFGDGESRQSDFEVNLRWDDVEKIIDKFCEVKQPEAIALRDATKLATAAKELGWRSPENKSPQSN